MPANFPDYTKAEWLEKVTKDLKGKPIERLNWEVEGETYTPFWHQEDATGWPSILPADHKWKIGVIISKQDLQAANKLALEALVGGANALWFSRYRPLAADEKKQLLKGIYLDIIECIIYEEEINGSRGTAALDLYHAAKRPDLQ
ncbi:MAG: hypothetical protein AAF840_03770, partial [Bacteroidota bacterium]